MKEQPGYSLLDDDGLSVQLAGLRQAASWAILSESERVGHSAWGVWNYVGTLSCDERP